MNKHFTFLVILIVALSAITIANATDNSADSSFVFLNEITWDSTADEIDAVMQKLQISRHTAYDFWNSDSYLKSDLYDGRRYSPYSTHGIYGGSGNLIGFWFNDDGQLTSINIDYLASSVGFRNVYTALCSTYGENYQTGFATYSSSPSMQAYVWSIGNDTFFELIVEAGSNNGVGTMALAESGTAKFCVHIVRSVDDHIVLY